MTFVSALGELPEMVLGLAFSFGCALLLGFISLRLLLGLMTRQRYTLTHGHNGIHNGINDPSHSRSLLLLSTAVAGTNTGTDIDGNRDATGGPNRVPAAAPHNGFARDAKSDAGSGGRVVEIPRLVAGPAAQFGLGDGGDAA